MCAGAKMETSLISGKKKRKISSVPFYGSSGNGLVPTSLTSGVGSGRLHMAEYGEWNRKGATLSDVTAKKEYGVDRDFIVKGIRAGKLEFREGAIWGNPY